MAMSTVLLDTNVASLLHPRRRNSRLREAYEPQMAGSTLAVSFQTVAELWFWAEQRNWGPQLRSGLEQFLSRFIVVPYTAELAQTWATVMTHSRRLGRRLEAGDGWIAASAVLYGVPLLTNDTDFVDLELEGLDVVSHTK